MASIYHLCSKSLTLQNHYPKPPKASFPPSTYQNFSIKPKDIDAKARFTGKNLVLKAKKNSSPVTLPESDVGAKETKDTWSSTMGLYLTERARAYTTLMRVVHMGSWFVTVPTWWAIALAAEPGTFVDAKMLALFGVVGVLTHGIGCTINDYFDRDIDAKVKRTKSRPLVSGEVTPFEALCCLGFELLLCYTILFSVNDLSRILWISSMLLIFTYPLMKRLTYWAQAYLGLAMNFSVLYGWSSVKGSLDGHILLPLYIGGICFTIAYDTIYAHQDKEDDEKVGLKSTAVLFANQTKQWTTGFTAACVAGLTLTGIAGDIGWPYYAFLAAASTNLIWQIWRVDLSSPTDCGKTFQTSAVFGALVFCGIVFGRLLQ